MTRPPAFLFFDPDGEFEDITLERANRNVAGAPLAQLRYKLDSSDSKRMTPNEALPRCRGMYTFDEHGDRVDVNVVYIEFENGEIEIAERTDSRVEISAWRDLKIDPKRRPTVAMFADEEVSVDVQFLEVRYES